MKDCSPLGGSLYNSRQMEIFTPNIFVSIHYEAVKNLLSQLTSRPITFTEDDYRNLISSPSSCLMLLCRDGVVVGMLTSNSKRVAANGLYRSLGFEMKDTNVYRMDLNR